MIGGKDGLVKVLDTETGEPLLAIELGSSVNLIVQAPLSPQFMIGLLDGRSGEYPNSFDIISIGEY